MELYKTPVILKIYEALTAIIDGKIKSTDDVNLFHIYSSSGNKFYYVYLEIREGKMIAFSNDNATYYEDYFGYPIIALMFIKKILKYDEKLAKELGGIYWKDLNQKYKIPNTPKYDFDQVAIDLNKGLTKEQNEGISKYRTSATVYVPLPVNTALLKYIVCNLRARFIPTANCPAMCCNAICNMTVCNY